MSKFAELLTSKKIDPRRVRSASHILEALRPEDRAIHLARRQKTEKSADKGEKKKPRSGRPITERGMQAALAGHPLSGPQKTRLLRAVNHILEQKKLEPVKLDALF